MNFRGASSQFILIFSPAIRILLSLEYKSAMDEKILYFLAHSIYWFLRTIIIGRVSIRSLGSERECLSQRDLSAFQNSDFCRSLSRSPSSRFRFFASVSTMGLWEAFLNWLRRWTHRISMYICYTQTHPRSEDFEFWWECFVFQFSFEYVLL